MEIRIGIVTGSRVGVNADGDEPGRIFQAVITDGNDVQNVQSNQAGEEYNPPLGTALVLAAGGNAYKVALALDDGIAPVMPIGGKRIYAVDADGEAEVCEVRLQPTGEVQVFNGEAAITLDPDGTVTVGNDLGSATLSPAGVWTFHGVSSHFDHPVTMASTLGVAGAVSSAVSVTAPNVAGTVDVTFAGKSSATHTHTTTTTGAPTSDPL